MSAARSATKSAHVEAHAASAGTGQRSQRRRAGRAEKGPAAGIVNMPGVRGDRTQQCRARNWREDAEKARARLKSQGINGNLVAL